MVKLWPSCARLTDQLGRVKGHLAEIMTRGGVFNLVDIFPSSTQTTIYVHPVTVTTTRLTAHCASERMKSWLQPDSRRSCWSPGGSCWNEGIDRDHLTDMKSSLAADS